MVRRRADWPTSGAEHIREARAKPIERRIAGRVAEGKNGEGGLFHGRGLLSRRNLAAENDSSVANKTTAAAPAIQVR